MQNLSKTEILNLFQEISTKNEISVNSCFIVAEIAKNDEIRPFIDKNLIILLLNKLTGCFLKSNEFTIQILRVIGNICYKNDFNKDLLLEITNLIENIVNCLKSDDFKIIKTCTGCLLNISMEHGFFSVAKTIPFVAFIKQITFYSNRSNTMRNGSKSVFDLN